MHKKVFYFLYVVIIVLGIILYAVTHESEHTSQMSFDKNTPMGIAIEEYNNDDYDKALDILKPLLNNTSKNNYDAFILAAKAHYQLGGFEESIEMCDTAISISPKNNDGYCNKGYALNELERYDEAIACFNKVLETEPEGASVQNSKGNALMGLGRYEEALECYNKQIEVTPKHTTPYFGKAKALYLLGRYKDAITAYDKYIELEPEDPDGYSWKAKCLAQTDEFDKAYELCDMAIAKNDRNAFSYTNKGWIYYRQGKEKEALESVEKALAVDENNADAYEGKVAMLFNQKRYNECIEFGNTALKFFPNNIDINWYMADCYGSQYEYEKAIEKYKDILKTNPKHATITSYIGWEYYYLQDYMNAEEYAKKALELDSELADAKDLRKALEGIKSPDSQRITDYVKSNYLYIDKVNNFEQISKKIAGKQEVTTKDILNFIEEIRLKDDIFTFVVHGREYDLLCEEEESGHIHSRSLGTNDVYIKIGMFTPKTASEFKKIIDNASDTENKNLIIDLRYNYGGLIGPANEILDYLLPNCVASNTIYRDGFSDSYTSNDYHVKFKKIFVLVNEGTASSSELLALGLKKYLNNVTIIGKPTLGKGVGQHVFENKAKKYAIFLVSFYWNVREQNIMGSRIYPDIEVKGDTEADYLEVLNKQLKN